MANVFPRKMIDDVEIARLAQARWTEPTRYQATVMTAIALMESGGDARAWYYNIDGDFPETFDRGLWGINEEVISVVMPDVYSGPDFADPEHNSWMAWHIWCWRYVYAPRPTTPSISLVYAYSGWTTYRKARIEKDPNYVALWNKMYPRAVTANK